jgi:aminopeptidase N
MKNILLKATLGLLAGCGKTPSPAETVAPPAPEIGFVADPHSFARPAEARVTHVSLDLTPDFDARRLHGVATLTIARATGAGSVVLDVRGLHIAKVTDGAGAPLQYALGEVKPIVGQPLTVTLPAAGDRVVVEYDTSPDAAAVQWLSPEQTAGKRLPFLFTQGEAILTRTWVPTQDSPGIRQTYDAVVHVPAGMRALMSAAHTGRDDERDANGRAVYRFALDKPVPPYLFALAVGDLAFKPIGANTGVYAEPSVVDRAASEFAEVDAMVAAAERLYGPYRWGRYDILVLPPSFPYGGMENPRLTFATPTVLAGDRSLVSLVAHELAHSWSGNLVTNATWDDFWLNEGFTTYLETRIMEALRGVRYADMLRQLGRQNLQTAIDEAGGPQAADTRLHLDLQDRDPDEATGDVAYEKGAAFLQTIESVVGRDRLDAFLREYFDRFAFQPMTSERLVAFMDERLFKPGEASAIDVHSWVFAPGLPANVPPVRSEAFAAVDRQIAAWSRGTPARSIDTSGWSTHEWLHLLRGLPRTIPRARLDDLDRAFHLSASGNSEILFEWLMLVVQNRYEPAFPALDRLLTSQGRRKFVRPLYQALAKTGWGLAMARDIYSRARPTYHSVSVSAIDPILDWK